MEIAVPYFQGIISDSYRIKPLKQIFYSNMPIQPIHEVSCFSINRGRIQDFQIEGMEGAQTIMTCTQRTSGALSAKFITAGELYGFKVARAWRDARM